MEFAALSHKLKIAECFLFRQKIAESDAIIKSANDKIEGTVRLLDLLQAHRQLIAVIQNCFLLSPHRFPAFLNGLLFRAFYF